MAGRVLDHFNQVSNCAICKEALKEPRLIVCGHTFCLGCLETMQITGLKMTEHVLVCPLCKKVSKIPKGGPQHFPLNVMAIQVQTAVDEARQTMKHTYCDACNQRVSERVFCRDCEVNLCRICEQNHRVVFDTHVIAEDLGSVPATRCGRHPGKMVSCYCSTCSSAICPLCATNNHADSSHRVIPLEEAKAKFVDQVKEKIGALKEGKKKLAGAQDELDNMRKEAINNYAFQRASIESASLKAVSKIKAEEEELKKRVQELHDRNIRMLNELEEDSIQKSTSIEDILDMAERSVQEIHISDFPDKSLELLRVLEEAENQSNFEDIHFDILEYQFTETDNAASGRGIGDINVPDGKSYTDLDIQKFHSQEQTEAGDEDEEEEEGREEEGQVEMRIKEGMTLPVPRPVIPQLDQTRRKDYYMSTLMKVGSHVLGSGIPNIPLKVIGLGLLPNNDVICAYNTNRMGQVVLCSEPDKHQVLYHRRKGISAFALYKDEECGVVLEDDCNISRLLLNEIPTDREVNCMTYKISCKASNIGALTFNPEGVMVISDTDKNCLTGIDRQSKRPFNLNGNRNEDFGSFSTTKDLASGPLGEIILYDGEKRRLAVFNGNTQFLHYIELPGLSSDCSIACDEIGVVYIADTKRNKVMKLSMTGEEEMVEILNADDGLHSPTCICVQDRSLAVANGKSFSEVEIRVFEFGEPLSPHF